MKVALLTSGDPNNMKGVMNYVQEKLKLIQRNDVMMGPNCYMLESAHLFDRTDVTMIEQGYKKERDRVVIGDDVWIGRDVMIIGSREIKSGSILAARCVLTKTFPEYSIIGGNPSKLIRSRK